MIMNNVNPTIQSDTAEITNLKLLSKSPSRITPMDL